MPSDSSTTEKVRASKGVLNIIGTTGAMSTNAAQRLIDVMSRTAKRPESNWRNVGDIGPDGIVLLGLGTLPLLWALLDSLLSYLGR